MSLYTLDEYRTMLLQHDRYYMYSDCSKTYHAGEVVAERIRSAEKSFKRDGQTELAEKIRLQVYPIKETN